MNGGTGRGKERPHDTREEQTLQYLTSTVRTNCGSYFTPRTKREILEAGVFSVGPTLHLKKLRGRV